MADDFQLRLLKLREQMRSRLHGVQEARKALVWTLRNLVELFDADGGALAIRRSGRHQADVVFSLPSGLDVDTDLLTAYVLGQRPKIPDQVLLAPVERRGRNWAVLVLTREALAFDGDHLDALFSVAEVLTDVLQRFDERQVRKVRHKIERKIVDRQQPKDVLYDILHGLRSLTRYDHSASVFLASRRNQPMRLVAEQIAWTKAKSRRIGMSLELDDSMVRELSTGTVRHFVRHGGCFRPADGGPPSRLPEVLEYRSRRAPDEEAMIYLPVAHGGLPSVLKIAARRSGVLDAYEARLVSEFFALTSLAVRFAVRTESLKERVLRSERKHVLANLTRGIAHDMNNALGSMLPLVQQLRYETESGTLSPEEQLTDLETIETSIQTCRRILGGMLSIARGSRDGSNTGNLRRSIEGALSVLLDSLRRNNIELRVDLPLELPAIRGNQGDLTQLFLNLFSNARDSMATGGRLTIDVSVDEVAETIDSAVRVTVTDTGKGIPEALRDRIWEPFFTTKAEGHGLGLAICRSILWDIGGDLRFEKNPGGGTSVVVSLPRQDAPAPTAPMEAVLT